MNATRSLWLSAAHESLRAAIGEARASLERFGARADDWSPTMISGIEREAVPWSATADQPPGSPAVTAPLDALCAAFGLSSFERATLALCAGVEMEPSIATLCATAHGDPLRPCATLGLAMTVLDRAHWSALTPESPLRRWRLVSVVSIPGVPLTASPLRIDERILHYLAGVDYLDERLAAVIEPPERAEALVPSHAALVVSIRSAWLGARAPLPPVVLGGADAASRHAIAAAAATSVRLRLLVLNPDAVPTGLPEVDELLRLCEREAALVSAAFYIDLGGRDPGEMPGRIDTFLERAAMPLIVGADRRSVVPEPRRPALTLVVERPSADEQADVWRAALGDAGPAVNGGVAALVRQFDLGAPAIRRIARDVLNGSDRGPAAEHSPPERGSVARALWARCRAHTRPRLDALASRIATHVPPDELVLPEPQRDTLREILAHVRQREVVHGRWGFADRGHGGLGTTALFAGTSGTGKTMAAAVLGNELGLDVYRVDLSQVVSKYIGETEKNLRRVFDAADEGTAILLFDEADALFGKRSEVKDSHDRYANIEVSYLLQRMEAYRGLAILTTNARDALDSAFVRRIRFVVVFPFPDPQHRAEIWRRVFPPGVPLDGIDPQRLARLNLSGGSIYSIAVNAAFLAADAGVSVSTTHVLRAARSEFAKLERPLTELETLA
jgi:hypothetical protein